VLCWVNTSASRFITYGFYEGRVDDMLA